MTKAEEAALKAYPIEMTPLNYQDLIDQFGGKTEIDVNTYPRCLFQEGYEHAEKEFAEAIKTAEDHAYFAGSESMREDIISLIESRIGEILGDAQPAPILREELREIIKRIKQ